MRLVRSFDDINAVLREIFDRLESTQVDMKGSRIYNLGPSVGEYDAVARKELNALVDLDRERKDQIQTHALRIQFILEEVRKIKERLDSIESRLSNAGIP